MAINAHPSHRPAPVLSLALVGTASYRAGGWPGGVGVADIGAIIKGANIVQLRGLETGAKDESLFSRGR